MQRGQTLHTWSRVEQGWQMNRRVGAFFTKGCHHKLVQVRIARTEPALMTNHAEGLLSQYPLEDDPSKHYTTCDLIFLHDIPSIHCLALCTRVYLYRRTLVVTSLSRRPTSTMQSTDDCSSSGMLDVTSRASKRSRLTEGEQCKQYQGMWISRTQGVLTVQNSANRSRGSHKAMFLKTNKIVN